MHLVEIFLPVRDNEKRAFDQSKFAAVRKTLVDRFGGATSFARAPAQGVNHSDGEIQKDDIIIMEVMTEDLDLEWWASYRASLEREFSQDEILIRASAVRKL